MGKSVIKWTGAAGDGNFDNPANWSPQQVPGPTDSVTISTSAATTITISQADAVAALSLSKLVTLAVNNGDSLTVGTSKTKNAALKNAGTITLNSNYNATSLVVGAKEVTLSGGGTIAMGNYSQNYIVGAAASDMLNNTNNLIEGGGFLGNGSLTFVNGAQGKVDANVATQLVVNTGTVAISNAGLLEATAGGGGLVLDSSVNNSGSGEILANGAVVYLANGMTVAGGTLASSHGGAIDTSGSATLDGTANTVDVTGSVDVVNNTSLDLLGTITNSGTIALLSSYNGTDLFIGPSTGNAGTVTLTGGGTLLMGDYPANLLEGAMAGDTLVNVNNTIEGAGVLGNGSLTLVNDATISATGMNVLFLSAAVTNAGLLESVGAGGLTVSGTVAQSAAGTILAEGNNVSLSGVTVSGGTLASASTFANVVTGGATFDGTAAAVTNAGSVIVANDEGLTLLGTFTNHGVVTIDSTYNGTALYIGPSAAPGTVTLNGGGTIALGNYPANYLEGSISGDTLVNVDNTITGAGQLGNGQLNLINDATISAAGSYGLVLNAAVTNHGLIEALSTGALTIEATVANAGGEILAQGGIVSLSGATITGGTLASAGGAEIQVINAATLDGTAGTVTNTGTVALLNNTALTLLGTIANSGTISLGSSYNNTELLIGPSGQTAGTVTLTGNGTVFLGDYPANIVTGTMGGETLVNLNNTITGAGQLGTGSFAITNDSTISATSASGSNALVLNATVTNAKLIEALSGGTLVVESTINDGKNGQIVASGGFVVLTTGADIQGGTLSNTGGAYFQVVSGVTLDGTAHSVTNLGTVSLVNNTALTLLGTMNNQGTISLNSTYNDTDLVIGSPTLTLTGGGTVVMGDYPANRIYGAAGTDVLDNVNNLIEGAGQFGAGQLTLINARAGVIDANGSNALTLTSNGSTVTNAGLIEATGAGGLIISTTVDSSGGGTIAASGGTVYLTGGTLAGGLITGSNGGMFVVSGASALDGSAHALTNTGTVEVNNGQALYLYGTIANGGVIGLNSTYNDTDLVIATPTLTLTGGGTIALGDYSANRIYGVSGADVLDNVNNIIEGAGQLGAGQLTLINEAAGIIDATGVNALVLNTGSTVINKGLIEATGSGGLTISAAVDDSQGGTILIAAGSSGALSGATLIGGVIEGGGSVAVTGGTVLDGASASFTNATSLQLQNGQEMFLQGAIVDQGTIGIDSNYNDTDLIIDTPTVTLTGGGDIVLTDNGNNRIYGVSGTDVLNNVNNTIIGAGQIGAGQLTLINGGTISATGNNALVLNLGSTGLNTGSMYANGAGGLIFQNGIYTNQGLIQADDGSAVTFQSGATLTNDNAGGTLTGGTYAVLDTGDGATMTVTGAAVTDLAATIELSGANAAMTFGGMGLGASLDMISAGGTLDLLAGNNLDVTANGGNLIDDGLINLGGGTLTAATLTIGTGADFAGFGVLDTAVVNDGTITIQGGMLTFDGPLSGTGTIVTGNGGTIVLMGGGTLSQGDSGNGTLELETGGYTLTGNTVSVMTLDVTDSASVTGFGTVSSNSDVTGTVSAMGGTLALTGAVSGDGTLAAMAGAVVQLAGGGDFAGAITGAGTAMISAALTLDAGASLSAATIMDSANVTLTAGLGVANQAGNLFMITGSGDPHDRHRAQIEIKGQSGSSFTNAGTLDSETGARFTVAFDNTGMVTAGAGELVFGKALSGSGSYAIASGATMDEKGGGSISGALTGAGTLRFDRAVTLGDGASLDVANVVQTDEVTLGSGESLTNLAGNVYKMTDGKSQSMSPHRAQVEVQGSGGSVFTNAGSLTSSAAAASFAVSFVNSGAVSASSGTLSFLGGAANNGGITAAGATISFADSVSGSGTLAIGSGGTMALLAGAAPGQVAAFQAGTGALDLSNPLSFDGLIMGFGANDQIDLVNTAETGYSFANGTLTVVDGSATVASLRFNGNYATGSFTLMGDGHNGTLITFK